MLNDIYKGVSALEWTKVSLSVSAKDIDAISGILFEFGVFGIEIIDTNEMAAFFSDTTYNWDYIDEKLLHSSTASPVIVFYLGTDDVSTISFNSIKCKLDDLSSRRAIEHVKIIQEHVNDQDWLHEWKKHFHAFYIGKVVIMPEWETHLPKDDCILFSIDPGSAFGTGQHPTTAMCIMALQNDVNVDGGMVLDIGCGSGILSIISLLLGASRVVCCDIDPAITEIVLKNAKLNPINLNDLEIYTGNILDDENLINKISCYKYDVIVANIVADVIISLAPLVPRLLKPNGVFIASGIIDERLAEVNEILLKNGLAISHLESLDGWYCVITHG